MLVLSIALSLTSTATPCPTELTVHFLDVGQADSIFVETPTCNTLLIDAGNNADSGLVINYLQDLGITRLDNVIGTHPHEDHVGGLDDVLASFKIGKVYLPAVTYSSDTYQDVLAVIKEKGIHEVIAHAGTSLAMGDGVSGVILAPNGSHYDDLNDYSVVLKVIYGQTSFLFTGDAEAKSEFEMLLTSTDRTVQADVLKVGHHGSESSTSEPFLQAVDPEYAVISVGADNDYGHPDDDTLAELAEAGVSTFRTDLNGTIVMTSDGSRITVKAERGTAQDRAPPTHKDEVDLNTATLDALQRIVNIGPERAQQIIAMRPWKSVDDLVKIKGIGSGRLADIKEQGLAVVNRARD